MAKVRKALAKEANWYLVFKVKCPNCHSETSTYEDHFMCLHCMTELKVTKDVQKLRARVDEHLNQPCPPAVIRKASNDTK